MADEVNVKSSARRSRPLRRQLRDRPDATGLNIQVASRLEQVEQAWELVHRTYSHNGLIEPNPHKIHTTQAAVNPEAVVVVGTIGGLTVSTLTTIPDGPDGLPLDQVYGPELDVLRAQGRKLMEVGLLADRREHIARSFSAIFEMMRYVCFRSAYDGVTDMFAGVHPHHAAFYKRYFAFEDAGPERSYPTVNYRPVVLLRMKFREALKQHPLPRGLASFVAAPVPFEVYQPRYSFPDAEIHNSSIGRYLQWKRENEQKHGAVGSSTRSNAA